jgi:hypothetical protein
MEIAPPSVVLDWYLGFLHHMLFISGGWPMWKDVRITEEVEYGDAGLPKRIGILCSVPDYRARFTELATRGWPWLRLQALGLLDDVLILHLERPAGPPVGSKWTSINLSGASKAVAERSYKLDGLVVGATR